MYAISRREFSVAETDHDPVRQKGCVKEARGVKYVSIVWRCRAGGACVRLSITVGMSAIGLSMAETTFDVVWVSFCFGCDDLYHVEDVQLNASQLSIEA